MKVKKFISIAAALAALVSCTGNKDLEPLMENLFLCLSCKPYPTKAADPDPVLISDYNILVYNCFNVLEYYEYVPEREAAVEVVHSVELLRGQPCTILAAANLGYPLGALSWEEAMSFRHYLAYPDQYSHGIPMAAIRHCTAEGARIDIPLERLMAAVDVYIDKSGLDADVNLNVKEICVGNCPRAVKPFSPGKAMEFFPSGFSKSGRELYPLERGEAVRLYLLENLAGENPSSYIEIKSSYRSTTLHNKAGESLVYRFRLGQEEEYNVGRNTLYKVVVRPTGDGLSQGDSWRIDTSGLE